MCSFISLKFVRSRAIVSHVTLVLYVCASQVAVLPQQLTVEQFVCVPSRRTHMEQAQLTECQPSLERSGSGHSDDAAWRHREDPVRSRSSWYRGDQQAIKSVLATAQVVNIVVSTTGAVVFWRQQRSRTERHQFRGRHKAQVYQI